ncbi:MAG: hypothetical protein DMG77_15835 [Acidobacteria bacterium]|nr:MAG: hypothetical protein DMG77_15835 [Acidobacteriota bacterium]
MRRLLQTVLLAAITPWTCAQSTVTAHFPSHAKPAAPASMPGVSNPLSGADFAAFRKLQAHGQHRLPAFPFGLFSDSLFSGSATPAESPAAAPSALNLMEALSALGKTPEGPPAPASQPLLIELQGDRYVRLNSGDASENPHDDREPIRVIASASPSTHHAPSAAVHPPAKRELPPAVLIFHDGHSEEVRDYTIVSSVIYARGDYYTDGYWNKKIELTALDLPETLKSNQARGVHFILPNAPNEVVTRP